MRIRRLRCFVFGPKARDFTTQANGLGLRWRYEPMLKRSFCDFFVCKIQRLSFTLIKRRRYVFSADMYLKT